MSTPAADERAQAGSGLFRRIYITFVITVLAAAVVGFGTAWLFTQRRGEVWVGNSLDMLAEQHDDLIELLDNRKALKARTKQLSGELGTEIAIYDEWGEKIVGSGPQSVPGRARKLARRLGQGHPLVHPRPNGKRVVLYPLIDMATDELVAIVHVRPRPVPLRGPFIIATVAILALLGIGARALSRSLTRRLGRLERSADRIASGELAHRAPLERSPPADEIDVLSVAFNQMAEKVQGLVDGQRILLANVSHELRTPIARVKVLVEILEDRVELLSKKASPDGEPHIERLRSGLAEMLTDTAEIEKLISDLLTSGRLELAGQGESLELQQVDVADLLEGRAAKFNARVECDGNPRIVGDELLLERLFNNLLANARRACPDGDLAIYARESEVAVEIAVEDEGHGIQPEDREQVFEPFRRLDAARSRDKGGVGLGLYLCRQICRAHDGSISAMGRLDGRPGARMVVTLPVVHKR